MIQHPIERVTSESQAGASGPWEGLSEAEAHQRFVEEGPNELPSDRPRGALRIAFEVAREPMFLLLVAAGGLYLAMGETSDALMLLGFVGVVMALTIVQERRTERALTALRDLSSPRALVIRDGVRRRIAGREVVRGDAVILSEGDRIPADALLRFDGPLSVDESLLTGESVPVNKIPSSDAGRLEAPGGDGGASVFAGTLVTSGRGVAEIVATGERSQLGRIGQSLRDVTPEPTPLQEASRRLVFSFAAVGLLACVVVVIAYGITRGGGLDVWKQGLLAGIALAMAILPEEFPVVLTVFLALGAWRISRSRVLTRRMPAVEMLGAATVLCVDKTGTLTQNRMRLRKLVADGTEIDLTTLSNALPEELHRLLEHAILASRPDPFDPMERALHEAGERWIADTEHLHPSWQLAREYPLTAELLAVSHVWETDALEEHVVATKGAPEAVADLCHLSAEASELLTQQVAELASEGLRVLGVACGLGALGNLPENHHDLDFELLGLIAFEDPLRPAVADSMAECRAAGVRVVMITGDYPATAQSIARQAGLPEPDRLLTGSEIDALSDDELSTRLVTVQVCARIVPEQKLRIVESLKASGEIVAMTGDGVNDAPALRSAHIGVAMGGRGTDVARESASLVLLDDDFSSIVAAIRLGRRIFDNIKKAIAFIIAVHVPIAGLSLVPVFFADWPLLLLPVHIVFLELIIDPTCALLFEAEDAEAGIMRRPPRAVDEQLFSMRSLALPLIQGVSVLGACLLVFLLAQADHSPDAARALTFATLVVAAVALILVHRSTTKTALSMLRVPNRALHWIALGAATVLGVVLFVPIGQRLFHFAPLHGVDVALSLAAGALCVLVFEILKMDPFRDARSR